MSYDPTRQVPPPPPNYPPQPGYPPQPQGYAPQQGYPPPQGYPQAQPQPPPPSYAPYAGPPQPYGGPPAGGVNSGAMWKALGTAGQICVIGGLILFLSLFMTWFSATLKCSGPDCNSSSNSTQTNTTDAQKDDRSASGFGLIFGGTSDLTTSGLQENSQVTENFGFFPLFLVLVASIALMALPLMVARGKMAAKQGQTFILLSAGVALLIELVYMVAAFASFSKTKANVDDLNKFIQAFKLNATLSYATGPSFGFWIGFLATLAAGGAYFYFNYLKKPALAGAPAGVYAQPLQYPGSQPYQPPQYQGQPYGQPQYPGSQPYGQPQYPPAQPYGQQPPQYPNQPPPYPGQ